MQICIRLKAVTATLCSGMVDPYRQNSQLQFDMINYLVFSVALLVIVSKFLDCYTTSTQIRSINQERNPFAQKLMKKFGIQTTIWSIFVISLIIVAVSIWLLFSYFDSGFQKAVYIVIALLISIIQFAVAHTNKTKKLNYFTRYLIRKV